MQQPEVLTVLPPTGGKKVTTPLFPPHEGTCPGVVRQPCGTENAFPATGRAHLVGIAGAGLRSLAEVLLGWGWQLNGSDLAPESLDHLAARGVRIHKAHAANQVPPDADLVIASDAIPPENPELAEARRLGIPVLSYFQALGRIMAGHQGVAIAGTHGKSTTTAMLAHLLVAAGLDPTVVCGAVPLGHQTGGRPGRSPLMLAEACEYRANFLHLGPRKAAILGIEPDHFDCYPTQERLLDAFTQFAALLPNDGLLVARHECRATRQVTGGLRCQVETFGWDPQATWSAQGLAEQHGRYRFEILHHQQSFCRVCLQVPGRHNVLNALAAAALAQAHGLASDAIATGLDSFRGVHRRLESRGEWRGVSLLDDYAHHPTAIAATLAAVREMYPGRRLWCVFQPHQASRTAALLDELAASLQNADKLAVAEIFRAREPARWPGEVTAADLAQQARRLGAEVEPVETLEQITHHLENQLRAGDVLITMGAGNIDKIHQNLPQPWNPLRVGTGPNGY